MTMNTAITSAIAATYALTIVAIPRQLAGRGLVPQVTMASNL
jgi:hypothetical protein